MTVPQSGQSYTRVIQLGACDLPCVKALTKGVDAMTVDSTGAQADYLSHLKAKGLRKASIGAYVGWVRRLDETTDADLLDLTVDDLEAWIAAHQWAPNSHQKAVQAVRYFYAWCHDTGRIEHDPAATLTPARSPRPDATACPEMVYRTALRAAQGSTYWRLRLAADTGLRRAELAVVHSDDVTGDPAILKVYGKGGKQRSVPLPDDLAAWIRIQHGYAFPGRDGGHMCADSVGRWIARALGTNAHSLRHRYAALAYDQSHDIEAVRELLGHASVATTQMYLHPRSDDMRRAASAAWKVA